jgi:hypothetical protein
VKWSSPRTTSRVSEVRNGPPTPRHAKISLLNVAFVSVGSWRLLGSSLDPARVVQVALRLVEEPGPLGGGEVAERALPGEVQELVDRRAHLAPPDANGPVHPS